MTNEPRPVPSGAQPEPPSAVPPKFPLPFSRWWPLAAGVASGIGLRLVFSGEPGEAYAAMLGAFIYLSPLLVGAVTVFVAETQRRRSWGYYFCAPLLANALYVLGTLIVMLEGLICAVVIIPLFAILGGIGGLLMGAICRLTNWPRQALLSVGTLPLLLGGLEPSVPSQPVLGRVEVATLVNAGPSVVWQSILDAPSIDTKQLEHAWAFRIGAPLPISGVTSREEERWVRRVTMGKGVYFDEVITEAEPFRLLKWVYRFHDDSFPPHALDDHVVIGGHYFGLESTTYTLTPQADGTLVSMEIEYRVSTSFNWYADFVARLLLQNIAKVNLDYYKRLSQTRQNVETEGAQAGE